MPKDSFTVSIALSNLLQSTNDKEFQFGLMLLNAFINEYSFSNGKYFSNVRKFEDDILRRCGFTASLYS